MKEAVAIDAARELDELVCRAEDEHNRERVLPERHPYEGAARGEHERCRERKDREEVREQTIINRLRRFRDERLFRIKMAIEAAMGQARSLHDVSNARALNAALTQHTSSRADDLLSMLRHGFA